MPSGKHKAKQRYRQVKVITPGNRNVTHYKPRKPKAVKCAECGKNLSGTLRLIASKLKNIAKSKKTPSRKFGGNLCSQCSRRKIINESRE